jgi:hypothetical protein
MIGYGVSSVMHACSDTYFALYLAGAHPSNQDHNNYSLSNRNGQKKMLSLKQDKRNKLGYLDPAVLKLKRSLGWSEIYSGQGYFY